ncbi:hypothetical protein CDAR_483751 [Caerostris darwini]|uniref:Uncharacterized protein n=1 Tax=Caerostris darwini TaxID=1538125 RepID=A0AAV4TNV5_9ARAC|nr:hypothetical protein CDAR_483751 [Caerostris darwini]
MIFIKDCAECKATNRVVTKQGFEPSVKRYRWEKSQERTGAWHKWHWRGMDDSPRLGDRASTSVLITLIRFWRINVFCPWNEYPQRQSLWLINFNHVSAQV